MHKIDGPRLPCVKAARCIVPDPRSGRGQNDVEKNASDSRWNQNISTYMHMHMHIYTHTQVLQENTCNSIESNRHAASSVGRALFAPDEKDTRTHLYPKYDNRRHS